MYIIKLILLLFLFFCFIYLDITIKKINEIKKIKVGLCTIGKEENLYVREYVSHYKNYNIDKIIIYDNNEENGEKFEEVISDYISNGFVNFL